MDYYPSIESLVAFVGGKYSQAEVEEYASVAKEMIDQYCARNSLAINDPPQSIVIAVNKELAKVMISERFTTAERVGEESYAYRDDKYEVILRKLNFLPGVVENTGSTNVSACLI